MRKTICIEMNIDNNVSLQEHTQVADLDDTVQFYISRREHRGIKIETCSLCISSDKWKFDER